MKRVLILLIILIAFFLFTLSIAGPRFKPIAEERPPKQALLAEPGEDDELKEAILEAVVERREAVLGFMVHQVLVDNFQYSEDGEWAYAWLGYLDPDTQEPLPIEPGLAMARREGKGWRIILPSDEEWLNAVRSAPESLLTEEDKSAWLLDLETHLAAMPAAPLSGYLLPWPKGEVRYLSQSVGHDKYTLSGTAHFAFDFYLSGKMWNLYAAKAGAVWMFKNDVPTCYQYHCDQSLGNYIVLQDTTTSPVSYQLYMHLAYDSIPPSLLARGAPVQQGQFIGVVDNTGQSWGHHLHFQVHTNPNSYYSTSVDVTFADVAINGGRPRVSPYDPPYCRSTDVCAIFQNSYVSGNTVRGDVTAPSGGILSPATAETAASRSLLLAGWAVDTQSGLKTAQFIANYDGTWREIGPLFSASPLIYDWDMCSANVPDGPVSLAMRLTDKDGNQNQLAGLTHVTKSYTCPPPPACQPSAGGAVVYPRVDFEGCVQFDTGNYPSAASLGSLGDNQAASIKVGANALATLYMDANYRGRGETLEGADAGLSDNVIGMNTASSLQIRPASQLPSTPNVAGTHNITGAAYGDVASLVWENGGGALSYEVQVTRTGGSSTTFNDLRAPYLHLEALEPGGYTWRVRGRNNAGSGPWSPDFSFTVAAPSASSPTTYTAPYLDTMETTESRWTKSGFYSMWSLKNDASLAYSGSRSWWYQGSGGDYDKNGYRTYGDLTSPPITIPGEGFFLRFWYRNDTEGNGVHWDQRRVQISKDGGPFRNVLQLRDDPLEYWLQSPFIDLSEYAGSTIRVRFRFDTIDAYSNGHKGWGIDDFSITDQAPPACKAAGEPNNTPAQAANLSFGTAVSGEICPPGDVDYYKFQGSAGDRIVVDIDAWSEGSQLDAVAYLYDADGSSLLAEHDDELLGVRFDPRLGYLLTRSGQYYVRVAAWNHPSAGDEDHFYTIRLLKDPGKPVATLAYPPGGAYLPNAPFDVTANVSDAVSGVSRVEFLWHSSNWLSSPWVKLGVDVDGEDGWKYTFDPRTLPEQNELAFYVRAYDFAGNMTGAGSWNVGIDRTPPNTSMHTLPAAQDSTAFRIAWNASDAGSGLSHFDIQWREVGASTWKDYALGVDGNRRSTWVVGQAGKSYEFRMRGVDPSGNVEAYPAAQETATRIRSASEICASPDAWEGDKSDNAYSAASLIVPGGALQMHNFCNPNAADRLNDVDWIKFNAVKGKRYLVRAMPTSENAAAALGLYAANGSTLLKEASAGSFGADASLEWIAPESGTLFVKINHIDGRVAGSGVSYAVQVVEGYPLYMPLIYR